MTFEGRIVHNQKTVLSVKMLAFDKKYGPDGKFYNPALKHLEKNSIRHGPANSPVGLC